MFAHLVDGSGRDTYDYGTEPMAPKLVDTGITLTNRHIRQEPMDVLEICSFEGKF